MWYSFPVFIFQIIFACPLSHSGHTVVHLVGQFITETKHGMNTDYFTPRCAGRFTKTIIVTRLTIKFHCEIYLTTSLECVLPGLINVRLILMSPSIMKYLPDDTLLYSLIKQGHWNQMIWHTLSTQGHTTLRKCELTRRMWVPRCLSTNDCAKVIS